MFYRGIDQKSNSHMTLHMTFYDLLRTGNEYSVIIIEAKGIMKKYSELATRVR